MSILCPDGKQLTVVQAHEEFSGPWGFKLRLTRPSGSAFLSTGSVGSFAAVGEYDGRLGEHFRREAQHQGRTLVSYEDAENSLTTFLWLGPFHELSWTAAGRDVSFDMFGALLATLDIQDSANVLLVRTKHGTGGKVTMSVAANGLGDVCGVSVMPLDDPSISVPAHVGKQVAGGIMWRQDDTAPDGTLRRTALVASATALTYLGFFEPDAPVNAELAESIRVELT